MKKIISLIGCGWLGQQLIPHLQPAYRLIATSRRARVLSIPTYPYHVHTDPLPAPIRDAHALIIALPPRAAAASDIARLIAQIPASTPFILVSSTSVYPQAPGNYDENSALRSDHPVTQIENAARTHPFAMIVRSGGQYGAGRLPLPPENPCADKRLNLISGANLCRALATLLHAPHPCIYNLVEPEHPWRSSFARRFSSQTRSFYADSAPSRLIDGRAITRCTSFRYR